MFEILDRSAGKTIGLKVIGKLTDADYDAMLPDLEKAIAESGPLRLLCDLEGFTGMEIGAFWQDFKFSLRHVRDFERLAVVGDKAWEEWYARLANPLFKADIRHFPVAEIEAAWTWLEH
jgi:hypothetical protein